MSLEKGDGPDATVDRVPHARLRLVGEGLDGIVPLVGEELVEKLGDVAGTEDLVDVGELLRLFRWEVGGEDAAGHAFSPQELAGCAWRVVGAR